MSAPSLPKRGMRTFKCYRFVESNLKSSNGNIQWTVGDWVKHTGPLSLCESGLHACKEPLDSLNNVYGDRWFQVEARGNIVEGDDKFCASEMRLVREIPLAVIRRHALDFAERVYGIWVKEYPEDLRVRVSLDATRAYLDDPNKETEAKMIKAAEAAWAARAAGAAWVAWAAGVAGAAGAAGVAGVAGAAEQKWQKAHLRQLIKEEMGTK